MIRLYRPRRRLMLGDIVELTVVVRDLDAAIERFSRLFGLKVHHRAESKEFGFENAILPTGSVERLKEAGVRVDGRRADVAWVHPQDTHGLFVELRKRETYA